MRKMVIPNRNRDTRTALSGPGTFVRKPAFSRPSQCNPGQKWTVGTTPITSLEFNPAGDRLAITSRNGYCLILSLVLHQ